MSENNGPKDQSMNEILGSIRRIISEDNAQSGGPKVAVEHSDEDILDLTEEVTEEVSAGPRLDPSFGAQRDSAREASIRREPVLGLHSPAPDTGETPAESEMEDAAPEITHSAAEAFGEAAQDEGDEPSDEETEPAPEVAAEAGPLIQPEGQGEPAQATGQEPVAEQPEVSGQGENTMELPEAKAARFKADIVSETATAATASAIGELTRVMEEKSNKLKLGTDEETISDMVKEMLRPMLREWLDENLPGIVERIVRREIQKLVDRAEADD